MMKDIFAQILDRKREAVAQLRGSRSLEDFRELALESRKNVRRHRLLRAPADARAGRRDPSSRRFAGDAVGAAVHLV